MPWPSLTILVPVVVSLPERLENATRYLPQLGTQCPGCVVSFVPRVLAADADPVEGIRILSGALLSAARPWLLWLEDDCELAPDFGQRLARVIGEQSEPAPALSLFTNNGADPDRLRRGIRYVDLEPDQNFYGCQCVLVPRDIVLAWGAALPEWYAEHRAFGPELALDATCTRLQRPRRYHLPSLVQHRGFASSLGFSHVLRSSTFGR